MDTTSRDSLSKLAATSRPRSRPTPGAPRGTRVHPSARRLAPTVLYGSPEMAAQCNGASLGVAVNIEKLAAGPE